MRLNKIVAVHFSILLSAANILGSSGLMVWVDHAIRYETEGLSAYRPLISYLMGLSLGCCFVGVISAVNKKVASRSFFLRCMLFAFCICFVLAMGEHVFHEWFGLLLRFLWGGVSGCTVILGRAMLVSSEKSNHAHKDLSVLSLALATLPLIIPALFAVLVLNQRSASAICASFIYAVTVIMFLLSDTRVGAEDSILLDDALDSRSGVVGCVSLIVINVCFFLALMIVPMVMARSYTDFPIVFFYLIVLCLWFFLGWLVLRCCQSISVKFRVNLGYFFQLIALGCGLWVMLFGSNFIFVFIMVVMFLSNILIQPILFLMLGRNPRIKLLLFGIQSGLYILVVSVVLLVAVVFVLSVETVVSLFCCFVALSLSCFYLFSKDFHKMDS